MPKLPPKTPWGWDIGAKILKFGPLLPKTGELWPTFFSIFGKHLGRSTSPPNFVGLSSKTQILLQINMGTPSAHTRRNASVVSYWWSIGTMHLSCSITEILRPKDIGVTTLTFWSHVTSSVTWPFDSAHVVSYWWSIGTMRLSCTVTEINVQNGSLYTC